MSTKTIPARPTDTAPRQQEYSLDYQFLICGRGCGMGRATGGHKVPDGHHHDFLINNEKYTGITLFIRPQRSRASSSRSRLGSGSSGVAPIALAASDYDIADMPWYDFSARSLLASSDKRCPNLDEMENWPIQAVAVATPKHSLICNLTAARNPTLDKEAPSRSCSASRTDSFSKSFCRRSHESMARPE